MAWPSLVLLEETTFSCELMGRSTRRASHVQANEIARVRRRFYICMWSAYCSIVGISTLVAIVRFLLGEDGSLHHFISTTSNHLVLVSKSTLEQNR